MLIYDKLLKKNNKIKSEDNNIIIKNKINKIRVIKFLSLQ